MKRSLLVLMIVCILIVSSIYCVLAQEKQALPPLIGSGENTVSRILHIGVIMGTWHEMGVQYGERAGEYILLNYDSLIINDILKASKSGWRTTLKTEDERLQYALSNFEKNYQELSYIFPEMVEFLQGIADGAAPWLAKSEFADRMPNFYKTALIAYGNLSFPPPLGIPVVYNKDDYEVAGGCNSTWISGDATATGETYASRTAQGGSFKNTEPIGPIDRQVLRQVSVIGIPKDPDANVFWFCGPAGGLSQSGAGIMNAKGVGLLTSGGGSFPKELNEVALDVGAKDFPLSTGCTIFADSALEAATLYTVGTPEYRNKTGRKQVLTSRASNMLFVDANEAYCVEKNANRFAIRRPGYMEKEDTYIVAANDFQYNEGSYDENLMWRSDQPMTMYSPQEKGTSTYYRFWTLYWNVTNNLGKIDRELMKRFIVTSHDIYDEDGKLYPAQEDRNYYNYPEIPDGPCSHRNLGVPGYPLGDGGSTGNSVMVLSSAEVYYTETHPCFYSAAGHEDGYDRSWHYVDLKPFAEFRQALWGY